MQTENRQFSAPVKPIETIQSHNGLKLKPSKNAINTASYIASYQEIQRKISEETTRKEDSESQDAIGKQKKPWGILPPFEDNNQVKN